MRLRGFEMVRLLLAALSVAFVSSASAADLRRPLPVKAPAPIAVATYGWTGCYVGAGGGYGMWNHEATILENGLVEAVTPTYGGRGWFGTVQVGCDYQVAPTFVIGAFADYDFGSIKGDFAFQDLVGQQKLKSSWAAGGRIGWLPLAQSQLMVFVSGGYTQARFDAVNYIGSGGVYLEKHAYSGWFIGSGYEYAIGWLPGLTWKTEYRFADYGTENVPLLFAGAPTALSLDSQKYIHTVRSELVWRFNFGGPVVARY